MYTNFHAGHRERLRNRFFKGGLDSFADHEVLELILCYAVAQRDTNEIAHRLMDAFGSLSAVLHADKAALTSVPGVGDISASLLMLFAPIARRLFASQSEEPRLTTSTQAARYIISLLFGRKTECLYLVCMDSTYRVLHKCIVAEGSIDTVPIYARNVASIALQHNATRILLAHNHPSSSPLPSRQDIQVTQELVQALLPLDIRLCDHIIVSGRQYYSFADKTSHTHLLPEGQNHSISDSSGISYITPELPQK